MVITVVSKTSIGSSILSLPAMKENIYLKSNGTLFATGYNRIVHGGRGDYVEFEKEHIVQKLYSLFNN